MPQKTTNPELKEAPSLVVSHEDAHQQIETQVAKGHELLALPVHTPDQLQDTLEKFYIWRDYCAELLRQLFSTSQLADEFTRVSIRIGTIGPISLQEQVKNYRDNLQKYTSRLKSILERIDLFPVNLPQTAPIQVVSPVPIEMIERITRRFPAVARQIRQRHGNRPTLNVTDEYDVQDLLHTLLRVFFDDIRAEEWTPSYAGGTARMDFLLKAEQIVIEVKNTRDRLRDRDIGGQLIEDIGRYHAHHDCKMLVCFVYDPDGWIANPDGIERDLSQKTNGIDVRVIIAPKSH